MKIKRRLLIAIILIPSIFLYLRVAGWREQKRIFQPVSEKTGAFIIEKLNHQALLEDVKILSSDAFEGRGTGTQGSKKAQNYIEQRFREIGARPFGNSYRKKFSFTHKSIRGFFLPSRPFKTKYPDVTNLYGYIQGAAKPQRYIVVSAHYDHEGIRRGRIFNGADDNASGVATLLAAAEYFRNHTANHSILFTAFDAEEVGLRGAEEFLQNPPIERNDIVFNMNLDMVSRGTNNRIFVVGVHQNPQFAPLVKQVNSRSKINLLMGHDRPSYLAGSVEDWTSLSDHAVFAEEGIPFLYLGVEDHEDYHRPTDDFERIDPQFFINAAETIIELLIAIDNCIACFQPTAH